MTSKYEINIDGNTAEVQKDTFLLAAIRAAGGEVPTMCHHKDLTPNGSCRMCLVEVEERGKKKMVTACNYPVRGEIKVSTTSAKVIRPLLRATVSSPNPSARVGLF